MGEKIKITERKTGDKVKLPVQVSNKTNGPGLNSSYIDRVLHLQRTIGNREVTRLIRSGVIGARLSMKESGSCGGSDVMSCVESHINDLKGRGQFLSPSTRGFFEPRFGADFSQVRVHTGSDAAEIAAEINAKAFTTGNNIFFNTGQYSPGTSGGKNLLAHELTHVVQQSKKNCSSNQIRRIDWVWPFNGSVKNNSKLPVQVWSDANKYYTIAGGASSNWFSEDVDHIKDNITGQWYKIGANTVTVDLGGKITGYRCKVSHAGDDCPTYGIMGQTRMPTNMTIMPRTQGIGNPLSDMSTFQAPGASGWRGALFGCYRDSCKKKHGGWDIYAAVGTECKAVVDGTITHAQEASGAGNYVILTSSSDTTKKYFYMHLSSTEPNGQVTKDKKVGKVGVSGNANSARPHLHFAVKENGTYVDPDGKGFSKPTSVRSANGVVTTINYSEQEPCKPTC